MEPLTQKSSNISIFRLLIWRLHHLILRMNHQSQSRHVKWIHSCKRTKGSRSRSSKEAGAVVDIVLNVGPVAGKVGKVGASTVVVLVGVWDERFLAAAALAIAQWRCLLVLGGRLVNSTRELQRFHLNITTWRSEMRYVLPRQRINDDALWVISHKIL